MKLDNKTWLHDLQQGSGSIDQYRYYSDKKRVYSKFRVKQAIEHLHVVTRQHKLTGEIEIYDYSKNEFVKRE